MHVPVLLAETIDQLFTDPEGIYVDGTLGGGGHTRELLKRLSPRGHIYALDRDREVLTATSAQLDSAQVTPIFADFRFLREVLAAYEITQVTGIMLDLGVSSFQLDSGERGFSFHEDAPLDMRMDRSQGESARDAVNEWSEARLTEVLFRYGEERYAKAIARAIVRYREKQSISGTLELAEIIRQAVPAKYRREKHPARRSFQGLRISINGEMEALQAVLPQAAELLVPGGRLAVITFHSLEDRIVKRYFQEQATGCTCPPDFPVCVCGKKAKFRLLARGLTPGDEELDANPRARSARLRAAEKIRY